ncbi:Gfo/Idh/MocA family oxidoreductase [uncultured Algimonas sp.]|uniref:Gfo/Idh/MocA family protein n=1 Tax=uncultured Algimonas sp. TaxID=1547920 RepID=UPI00262F2F11|nr:Gfo/Idh/MocA family oxidoreductase [uncultured Algimonas sp.]
MSDVFKVGIVGAGVFAGYHAGKVAGHDRAVLSGVFDRNAGPCRNLAARYGAHPTDSLDALASASDALIVAIPANGHLDAALSGLAHGCHLLMEKPLAATVAEAERIVGTAAVQNRVLQVGHQERIVMDAIGLQDVSVQPNEIAIVRHTGRATRNLDVGVVMDLMIHDIDLLNALYGLPDWISTERARSIYSDRLDDVSAELGYGDMTAYLSASRNAEPERRWTLRFDAGTVEIDFNAKTLRHDTPFDLDADFGSKPDAADSLAAAFDRFVAACLDGASPLASGEEGLAAVRIAATIEAN